MASPPPPPAAAANTAIAAAQWRRARVETTIKLSTTGGTVWGAAEAAIAFFERHWDALVGGDQQHEKQVRILELGAGCGKLGLTLALNRPRPRCSVLLTEQPGGGALEHLERNVRLNVDGNDADRVDARAAACDWADFVGDEGQDANDTADDDEQEQQQWRTCQRISPKAHLGSLPCADVIIGSDLIYLLEGARALPRTIAALLRRSARNRRRRSGSAAETVEPVAYYSHTRHRFDALDVEFEEQCATCGLELVEMDAETGRPVGDGGRDNSNRAASSPPPFTELFPEHRVAMYRLRLIG